MATEYYFGTNPKLGHKKLNGETSAMLGGMLEVVDQHAIQAYQRLARHVKERIRREKEVDSENELDDMSEENGCSYDLTIGPELDNSIAQAYHDALIASGQVTVTFCLDPDALTL